MIEEKEQIMIESMLKTCKTKEECKKWIFNEIADLYTKAENLRNKIEGSAVQNLYKDIGILSRISFYLDKHTQHLPNNKGA